MKYYQRRNGKGDVFFVNERGEKVSEAEARKNLVESSAPHANLDESSGWTYDPNWESNLREDRCEKRLSKAFASLGLTEAESHAAAKPTKRR